MSATNTTSPEPDSALQVGGKKQATRTRIIDCAIPLFSEFGYDKITMESIAKAAGISRANIYLHFKAKAELVAAMLEQLSPEVVASYRTLDSIDANDIGALRRWVDNSSQLWVERHRQLETLEHALAVEPLVSARWYQTLSESADAMTTFLARYPEGPARGRARLAAITTMLSFERTLYFVLVRDAPAGLPEVIDVLTAQWHAVLGGDVVAAMPAPTPSPDL
ncbi:TetR/AcrR family transcriptional regulator [Rhodococcus erythropolis]|uniref:TetR/AcrR family transcriptional regulator n=1 Tax=Rhodococcus erythropolis TaxID=1833 RepID=UPI00210B47D0|nr:TetR/AcrR family transcriptional regulator [Rhodococcus erythropolis]MCQ4128233.1 TetR/AcrR family transcriptional regulator [Rhodococcus erythropolis]